MEPPTSKLPKIGPGLGSRSRVWGRVDQKIPHIKFHFNNEKVEEEKHSVAVLSAGAGWLDFIPLEWVEIYGTYYNETKDTPLPEKELVKIDKDVPRTFGLFVRNSRYLRLNFPNDLQRYYGGLRDVLIAVSRDRGYCQGINFIAASVLLQTASIQSSAIILNFLLKHRKLEILFDPRYSALLDYMKIFEKRLRKYVPNVYHHFKKCDFTTVSYAIEWFTTCFIVTCPGELSLCVLDLLMAGVEDAMLRVGLGLLKVLESKLVKLDFEGLHQKFKHLVATVDPYDVMVQALPIVVPRRMTILEGMSLRIDALDPGSNGNLKFSSIGGINIQQVEQLSSEESDLSSSGRRSGSFLSADKEADPSPPESVSQRLRKKVKSGIKFIAKSTLLPTKKRSSPQLIIKVEDTMITPSSSAKSAASTVGPSVAPSKQPGNALTIWWNETWRNALLSPIATARSEQGGTENTSHHRPQERAAPELQAAPRVAAEQRRGDSSKNEVLPPLIKPEATSGIWKNHHHISSPAGATSPKTSDSSEYDGDSESSHGSSTKPMHEKPVSEAASTSGQQSPVPEDISEFSMPHSGKLRHRLLLWENAGDKFEEKNVEDTFLDQGGEVVGETSSDVDTISNFRIASALDALQECWFPEHVPKRKIASLNRVVRSKHKNRKPKEVGEFIDSVPMKSSNEDINENDGSLWDDALPPPRHCEG